MKVFNLGAYFRSGISSFGGVSGEIEKISIIMILLGYS